ncbi:MAG: tyrosine-type recombinase/integrase, partial [Planctomycetota bacterium]
MASIGKDKGGRKRILFVAEDGSRKTIRLGKASMRQAEAFKVKVEALVAARLTGNIDPETARWIAGLS